VTSELMAGPGGTMEWPLLAASDLIVGLGVDPAELIPAAWGYPARTILVCETSAGAAEAGRRPPAGHHPFTGT